MEETFLFLLLSYALTPSLSQRKRESPNAEPHLATRFEATILNST